MPTSFWRVSWTSSWSLPCPCDSSRWRGCDYFPLLCSSTLTRQPMTGCPSPAQVKNEDLFSLFTHKKTQEDKNWFYFSPFNHHWYQNVNLSLAYSSSCYLGSFFCCPTTNQTPPCLMKPLQKKAFNTIMILYLGFLHTLMGKTPIMLLGSKAYMIYVEKFSSGLNNWSIVCFMLVSIGGGLNPKKTSKSDLFYFLHNCK